MFHVNLVTAMGQSRNTAHTNLQFNVGILERMSKDKNMRVMLFCAVDAPGLPIPADIAFPAQIELKVNGEPYGGNLRGIKKKPGTTRPADITDLLRKSPPSYTNNVSLTYAATDKVCSRKRDLILVQLLTKAEVRLHNLSCEEAHCG